MANAIKMKLYKPQEAHDPSASKFFGAPAIPVWMEQEIEEDEVFLAQIRLSDIAQLDTENILPHEGWLYFFIKAQDASAWTPKQAVVRYSKDEPELVIDDFNEASPIPEGLNEAWLIEFAPATEEDDDSGMKLLGDPYDWNYAEPAPLLLLQYDPLDSPVDFLGEMDGVAYFFAGKDMKTFTDAVWHAEYS